MIVTAAAYFAFAFSPPAQEITDELAEVTVRVVDEDGKGAAGVPVYALPADQFNSDAPKGFVTGTTDQNGLVDLDVMAETKLRFDAEGGTHFIVGTELMDPLRPDSIHSLTLVLKEPDRPLVTFQFVDMGTGKPVPGVNVTELNRQFMYAINAGAGLEYHLFASDSERTFVADAEGSLTAPLAGEDAFSDSASVRVEASGYVGATAMWQGKLEASDDPNEPATSVVRLAPSEQLRVLVSDLREDCTIDWTRKSTKRDLQAQNLRSVIGQRLKVTSTYLGDGAFQLDGIKRDDKVELVVRQGPKVRHTLQFVAGDSAVTGGRMEIDLWDRGRVSVRLRTRTGKSLETVGAECTVIVDRALNEKRPLGGLARNFASVAAGPTDAAGRWSYETLRAGVYRLSILGAPHRRTYRGVHETAAPVAVTVSRSEAVAIVEMTVVPDLVCRGEITDENGDPCKGRINGFAGRTAKPFTLPDLNTIHGPFETPPVPPGIIIVSYASTTVAKIGLGAGAKDKLVQLRSRLDAGARSLVIRSGPNVKLKGRMTRVSDSKGIAGTAILQDTETGLQRYPKYTERSTLIFDDAVAGEYVLWGFTDDGLFADPVRLTAKENEPRDDLAIALKKGARLTIDASQRDRHLRCDIRLPSGESLERILAGISPTITVPAGPVEIALEEIDGEWSTTFQLDLAPGETATREAK